MLGGGPRGVLGGGLVEVQGGGGPVIGGEGILERELEHLISFLNCS